MGRKCIPDVHIPIARLVESSFSSAGRVSPAVLVEMCISQFLESVASRVLVEATKCIVGGTAKELENYDARTV